MEEGPGMALAFVAVMLAGAAVVPLGAADPPARLRCVLEDAGCVAAIAAPACNPAAAARLLEAGWRRNGVRPCIEMLLFKSRSLGYMVRKRRLGSRVSLGFESIAWVRQCRLGSRVSLGFESVAWVRECRLGS